MSRLSKKRNQSNRQKNQSKIIIFHKKELKDHKKINKKIQKNKRYRISRVKIIYKIK